MLFFALDVYLTQVNKDKCLNIQILSQCQGWEPGAPAGQRAGSWRHRLSVCGRESPGRSPPLRGAQQHTEIPTCKHTNVLT